MTKEVRCLEDELTSHIKFYRGKVAWPTRHCRRCKIELEADRYFECNDCTPELGEQIGDIFSGGYDKSSRRR